MGQTEDEESSSGYDSFDGVNSISNPTYSGPTIHSRYAAALNNSDTKYSSEVQARPELSLSYRVLHSHWSRNVEAWLSLVESFRVLLAPALLCHKEPAMSKQSPLLGH